MSLTMERTINNQLDPEAYDRAISRREHMKNTQLDPMMSTGAGTMSPESPGSPGSRVDEYMPETQMAPTADVNKALDLEKLQGLFEGHRAFAPGCSPSRWFCEPFTMAQIQLVASDCITWRIFAVICILS